MVSEHGRGFWGAVLDPPRDGAHSPVGFLPEGPGLAALESPELAEMVAERLTPTIRPGSRLRPTCRARSTRPATTCW
jgi:hypothetical protein